MKKFTAIFTMVCICLTLLSSWCIPGFASEAEWYEGWTLSGAAKLDNGIIAITSSNKETGSAAFKTSFTSLYDMEWTMKVSQFRVQVKINDGKNELFLVFDSDTVSYRSVGGAWYSFPHNTDDKTHTYRVKMINGTADLFLDGYYVTTIDAQSSSVGSRVEILTAEANGVVGSVEISDFKMNPAPVVETEDSGNAGDDTSGTPQPMRWDFDSPDEIANWTQSIKGTWFVEDGLLRCINSLNGQSAQLIVPDFPAEQDYVFKMRFRMPTPGIRQHVDVYSSSRQHGMWFDDDYSIMAEPNWLYRQSEMISVIDGEWHDFTMKTAHDGALVSYYVDDKLISEIDDNKPNSSGKGRIALLGLGAPTRTCDWQIDWMSYDPVADEVELTTPFLNAEYLEGNTIFLNATVADKSVPSVDYKINGKVIATGYAPDYRAILEEIPAGSYHMTVGYGEKESDATPFTVVPAVECSMETTWNEDGSIQASLNAYDRLNRIHEVEYYLSGISVAKANSAPYEVTVPAIPNETRVLDAVVRDKAGSIIGKASQELRPSLGENKTTNFSNDIYYEVSGESGSATAVLSNGNHKLFLKHTPDSVVYLTSTGEETYNLASGTGRFQILTDGVFADVYRNGQLAFSYLMPQTDEVEKSFQEEGLTIANEKVTLPERRKNYLVLHDVSDKATTYQMPSLGIHRQLDFLASAEDQIHLAVNDGYFRTDLSIRDGKIYVWETVQDTSQPRERYVCDAVVSDSDVYYRVETSAGTSRLYGNGKWLTSFREPHTHGNGSMGVEIAGGNGIKYLAVSDYNDIYLYEEDFKGTGEIDAIQFWRQQDASVYVDKNDGELFLNGIDATKSLIHMTAHSGHATFAADVEIKECNEGFWMVYNLAVPNPEASSRYNLVGYNATTGKLEMVSKRGATITKIAEVDAEIPLNKTVRMEVRMEERPDGRDVTFYIDGKPMLQDLDANEERGSVGFMLSKSVASIKNVVYRGDAKPMTGVESFNLDMSSLVLLEDGDTDTMKLIFQGSGIETKDGGKTYTKISGYSPLLNQHFTTTKDGNIVAIESVKTGEKDENGRALVQFVSHISYDKGKSFTRTGVLTSKPDSRYIFPTLNRLNRGPSGKLYMIVPIHIGNEDHNDVMVCWSDDDGKTWHESNVISSYDVGHAIDECIAIELNNGIVRLFTRTNAGYLCYIDSYDGGNTFDYKNIKPTPFLEGMNCYNIQRDYYEENTLYMLWSNDDSNCYGMPGGARTNYSVAKSTDDGETWEFVGTALENMGGDGMNNMNLSLNIGKDYGYMTSFNPGNRQIFFRKDTQKPTKRFTRLHLQNTQKIEKTRVIIDEKSERVLLVNPDAGTAMLRGDLIESAAYGDAISLDIAAVYVGGKAKVTEDGSATIRVGTTDVVLAADALSQKDGRWFVNLETFADTFALPMETIEGIKIIGGSDWTPLQKTTLLYSIDLFANGR